jgi:hypothetical protein
MFLRQQLGSFDADFFWFCRRFMPLQWHRDGKKIAKNTLLNKTLSNLMPSLFRAFFAIRQVRWWRW